MSNNYTVGPEVNRALALVKRGSDELLVESEFVQKLARSDATGTPLRCKLGLDATALSPEAVRAAVVALLEDGQYAQRAAAVAAEIRAMPDAGAAVAEIVAVV